MSARFAYYRRGTTRRRPVLRWLLCTAGALAGIGLGVAGSAISPWGWAPAPGSLDAAPAAPAPGRLLLSGEDAASVPAATVRHFGPPAQATGTAVFVRGNRHGHRIVYVECYPGGMLLIEGEPLTTWKADGTGIGDQIAQALCHAHPLLKEHQLEQTT